MTDGLINQKVSAGPEDSFVPAFDFKYSFMQRFFTLHVKINAVMMLNDVVEHMQGSSFSVSQQSGSNTVFSPT